MRKNLVFATSVSHDWFDWLKYWSMLCLGLGSCLSAPSTPMAGNFTSSNYSLGFKGELSCWTMLMYVGLHSPVIRPSLHLSDEHCCATLDWTHWIWKICWLCLGEVNSSPECFQILISCQELEFHWEVSAHQTPQSLAGVYTCRHHLSRDSGLIGFLFSPWQVTAEILKSCFSHW